LADEIGSTFLYAGYYDMGNTYHLMFQLDKALECFKESLKYYPIYEHITNGKIGYIYFLKYELEKAQEYLMKSLKLCKKIGDKKTLADVLYNLILIFIELMNLKKATHYLVHLEEISTETGFEYISQKYRFASILVLKESGDISDIGKAAELLKSYLKEKDLHSKLRIDALYALLEIRLKELQLTVNDEALRKVQKRLHHLEVEAEDQEQQWLLANVYRLQSQLVLVELDAQKAIEFLDKAQTIAEEINVELLKKEISADREKIEQQLTMWNKLQEQKAPISETVKLVSLNGTMKTIKEETVLEEKDKDTGKIIEYRKLFALKI
jgi:tetratricopeptide (TPR) repeat protein